MTTHGGLVHSIRSGKQETMQPAPFYPPAIHCMEVASALTLKRLAAQLQKFQHDGFLLCLQAYRWRREARGNHDHRY